MVDHARLALRSRGLAIRAGFGRTARGGVEGLAFSRHSGFAQSVRAPERPKKLSPAEILGRIDRGRTLADLEMQLRRHHQAWAGDRACRADRHARSPAHA